MWNSKSGGLCSAIPMCYRHSSATWEYVSGCLQQYALRLVDIKMTSWLFLVALAMINYIRMITVDRDCKNGFPKEDLDQNEKLREQFEDCEEDHQMGFLICGGFLLIYVVGLFIVGRVYQFRIIGRAGVLCVDDYADFLIFEEAQLLQADRKKLKTKPETGGRKRKSSVVAFKNAMHGFLQKQKRLENARKKSGMKSKAVLSGVLSKKFLSRHRIEPETTSSSRRTGCLPNDSDSFLDDSKRSANRSVKSKNTFSFFRRSANHKATADGKHSAATRAVLTWQSPARKFVMKMKERRQPVSARLDKVGKGEKKINFSVDLSEIFFPWQASIILPGCRNFNIDELTVPFSVVLQLHDKNECRIGCVLSHANSHHRLLPSHWGNCEDCIYD